MKQNSLALAKWACVFSGFVWGLFWIPLRILSSLGFEGPWATVMFYAVPLAVLCPFIAIRWRGVFTMPVRQQIAMAFFAAGMVLYASAFLYTEVVRAMFLYYLTPIWGFILARLFLGDPITPIRVLSICFGVFGALIIFELETGIPWPRYSGDWMALTGGMLWAVTSLLLLMERDVQVGELGGAYFIWVTAMAIATACLAWSFGVEPPQRDALLSPVVWLVPVAVFIVIPGVLAAIYGATKLNPGTVGLLFMTEISVGTVAALLWAGEPFGLREIAGIVLITSAGIAEPLRDMWCGRAAARAAL